MRFLRLCLLLLAAPAIAPAAAHAACETRPRATIPFEVVGGSLLAPVVVNGISGVFLVDTGAARSMVTREAVRHLDLARDEWVGTAMRGIGGVENLPNANPRTITFGGVPLVRRTLKHDTSLTVGTMPRSSVGGHTIDGLLGRDFLSLFDLVLDMPLRRITLFEVHDCAGRFLPWSAPYSAIAVENPMESALVVPVTLDGTRLRALLDTGSGSSMVAATGMSRLGLTATHLAADPSQSVNGLGARTVVMRRHRFTALQVGSEMMERPVFWVAQFQLPAPIVDMLLGADWLAGKRVWISFATKQVFVAG